MLYRQAGNALPNNAAQLSRRAKANSFHFHFPKLQQRETNVAAE